MKQKPTAFTWGVMPRIHWGWGLSVEPFPKAAAAHISLERPDMTDNATKTVLPARPFRPALGNRMTWRRLSGLAALVFCLLAPGPAWADAEAVINIQLNGPLLYIQAEIDTGVDQKTAWSVLTDYNRWAEFIPDLLVSRVISAPGEPIRLEQRGRLPQLPNLPLVMISQIEETPMKSVRFQRLAGNIKTLAGEWQIQGKKRAQLRYQAMVEPGFPLPPQLSVEIFRQDAKARLEALTGEMARRAERPGLR